jgi:hypothetical protein
MASLSLATPPQTRDEGGHEAEPSVGARPCVVATFAAPEAADYAAMAGPHALVDLTQSDALAKLRTSLDPSAPLDAVLFLPRRLNAAHRAVLDGFIGWAKASATGFLAVVSTFRVHLGDEAAAELEKHVLDLLQGAPIRVAVFRPGHILSDHSVATRNLRRFSFLASLVPGRLRSCCVDASELFAAIEQARQGSWHRRTYTLVGPNQPWREWLRTHRRPGVFQAIATIFCYVASILLLGHLAALVLDMLARWRPAWRHWNFDTLKPRSMLELLALCNPHNFRHVKVVGYNNGVVHFGHRYPGKTVVSTVLCNRVIRVGPSTIKADCGATIRKARDFLADAGQELYVIPNYSYVCLGTAFFVPIHGSASDYATVAETITRVLLYDPATDRLIRASSDEPAFRERVYDMAANVLLLRLCVRVKPKARYFVDRQELDGTGADDILNHLRDTKAANVEIRKSKAAGTMIELSKYYQDGASGGLEVPRDSLGRLWDRLEENALTSFLMHALTRWLAWHVELFFTADEFKTFWQTHQTLPLKKIQLRFIRRDGLPHSPFCEHDCVSVDMFMFRWNRTAFETYLKQTFAVVRSNPGKHSQ